MSAEDEKQFWDDPPGGRQVNAWGDPPYDVVAARLTVLDALGATVGQRLLDLGCGPGRLACEIAAGDHHVTGVDVSSLMISDAFNRAERGYMDRWTAYPHGIAFLVGDGRDLPSRSDLHFDHAYSITMFEHIPHEATKSYLHQVCDRLPAGGRFLFTHAPGYDEPAPFHYQCGEPSVPVDWALEAGFATCDIVFPLPPSLDAIGGWCWDIAKKG